MKKKHNIYLTNRKKQSILNRIKQEYLIILKNSKNKLPIYGNIKTGRNVGLCEIAIKLYSLDVFLEKELDWFKDFVKNDVCKNPKTHQYYDCEEGPFSYNYILEVYGEAHDEYFLWDINDTQSRLDWLNNKINELNGK